MKPVLKPEGADPTVQQLLARVRILATLARESYVLAGMLEVRAESRMDTWVLRGVEVLLDTASDTLRRTQHMLEGPSCQQATG